MVRSEVGTALHRLANYIECQITELTQLLLVESRADAARDIIYSGCSFIHELREARDDEGGDA
jgi:hypothetical protein